MREKIVEKLSQNGYTNIIYQIYNGVERMTLQT